MKLKARITAEVEVTKAEAEILIRNAEFLIQTVSRIPHF